MDMIINIRQYMYIDTDMGYIFCQTVILIPDHRSQRRPWWQHFIAIVSSHRYSKIAASSSRQEAARKLETSGIQLRYDEYVEAYKGVKELLPSRQTLMTVMRGISNVDM